MNTEKHPSTPSVGIAQAIPISISHKVHTPVTLGIGCCCIYSYVIGINIDITMASSFGDDHIQVLISVVAAARWLLSLCSDTSIGFLMGVQQ
jgi:hypothetical protein